MALNAEWHRANLMPKNPTAAQRLAWHTAHAKACGCRPFTAAMKSALQAKVKAAKAKQSKRR